MRNIKFTYTQTSTNRRHYLNQEDVCVLLARLPEELWKRLRTVHFNDRAFGNHRLGYVNGDRCEIAICALPENVSLSRFLVRRSLSKALPRRSPLEFGALRGRQWPAVAVRRFLLYYVFLHELGHLQVVEPDAREVYRKFAGERLAQEFADAWWKQLGAQPLVHADPIHNRPGPEEFALQSRIDTAPLASAAPTDRGA
jgi:hypothetical protein